MCSNNEEDSISTYTESKRERAMRKPTIRNKDEDEEDDAAGSKEDDKENEEEEKNKNKNRREQTN